MVVGTTYFRLNGRIYEQTFDMAMGSPLLHVLANLFMEEFEEKAIAEAPHSPMFWWRYVDDTGVVVLKQHENELFQHINKQHKSITFTIKQEGDDNSLPMLDIRMIRENDSITTDI